MKKDKNKIKENFFEGLTELVFALVFFGIGALILHIFGIDLDAPNIDFDSIALIGIVAVVAVVGIVCAVLGAIKLSRKRSKKAEQTTTHNMKLNPTPFEMIKSGEKTIELRLFDEKRRQIGVGDEIIFTNNSTGETLTKRVVALHTFASFDELYRELPLLKCGYTQSDVSTAAPEDMESYYSKEEQAKYGVLGIELG